MRRLIHLATLIVCLPLAYFVASLLGAIWPGGHSELPSGNDVEILLARGPAHYDLMLPLTSDLRQTYGFAEAEGIPMKNPFARWLLIGWGAQSYYTTPGATDSFANLSVNMLWQAAKGDAAVIRVAVVGDVDRIAGLDHLNLSSPQYDALLAVVAEGFQRDQTGAPVPVSAGDDAGKDALFAARGRFSIFHTANDWVGETLRGAGLPFGAWTPTPQAVALSLAWRQLS